MSERSPALRGHTVLGFLVGGIIGFLLSPRIQYSLRHFGVDQVAFYPAALIILTCAIVGALLALAARRNLSP